MKCMDQRYSDPDLQESSARASGFITHRPKGADRPVMHVPYQAQGRYNASIARNVPRPDNKTRPSVFVSTVLLPQPCHLISTTTTKTTTPILWIGKIVLDHHGGGNGLMHRRLRAREEQRQGLSCRD